MPDYPDDALAAAERAIGASLGRGEPSSLIARRALDAAAPVLAEAVAARIRAFADRNAPMDGDHVPSARRRAFRVAARVAAGAFTTEAESKQMAAEALVSGQYLACNLPEEYRSE